jgi:hypothetical protein
MPGAFPDYPAPVVRYAGTERESRPRRAQAGRRSPGLAEAGEPLPGPIQ